MSSLGIHMVIFGAGAVLMALEILAMRLVAKNFGSALREVSAVIAVFMAAMSAGYALGGRLGDRRPQATTLTAVLVVGGLLTLLIPGIEAPVADAVFESSLPLAVHAAVVATILFAAPACFIASVTPIAVRLRIRSVQHSGSVAGSVSAISTVGSILGTIAGGYVLIAYLQLSRGISLLGLLLCGLGILAARMPRALGGLAVAVLLWTTPAAATVVLERDTSYHHLTVEDYPTRRVLRFNNTLQGSISLTDPLKGAIPYIYYVHNAFIIAPEIQSALVIGLGSGSVPRHILHYYPGVQVQVAEIDPVVVEVAQKYFDLPTDSRLHVETVDGRVFLKRTKERFDFIFVDAFGANRYGITIPPHLTTREFLEEAKAKLSERGILVYNSPQQFPAPLTKAFYKTIAAVFPEVYVFNTHHITCLIMAVVTPRRLTAADLQARGEAAVARGPTVHQLLDRLSRLTPAPPAESLKVPVMTDDYAPVDLLQRGAWRADED